MVRLFQSRGIFAAVARLRLATLPVDSCRACFPIGCATIEWPGGPTRQPKPAGTTLRAFCGRNATPPSVHADGSLQRACPARCCARGAVATSSCAVSGPVFARRARRGASAAACVDRDPQTVPHDGDDSMSSVRRCARLCSRLTVLLSVAACASSDRPTGPQSRPEFNISDAVHEGGPRGSHFLPLMVASPTFRCSSHPGISPLNPEIALCAVRNGADANCGGADGAPAVIVVTTTSAPRITLDSATTQYHVNWVTKGPAFLAGHTYRVHVTAGASGARRELGFADVLLTSTPGQARNVASGDLIVLNDGATLPIHFRIETGIPGSLTLSAPTASVAVGNADVITGSVADLHGAPLAGATVAWTVATTPATGVADATQPLNPTSGQTSTAGTTATTFKVGTTPGTATVSAASAGLSALMSVTVSQSIAAAIAASGPTSQSAPAGGGGASPPALIVPDGAGNPVAGGAGA